jgi:gluconolactonase
MKSQSRVFAMLLVLQSAPVFAQAVQPPPPTPTETTTPDIPGVVAAGTRVEVVAQGLRGTEGPIAMPDGSLLFTEQTASVITKVDAQGNRTSFLEKTNDANGVTFDSKGRLIATQPATKEIAVLTPTRIVLASSFEGQPLTGPNDVIADKKGGVYFSDPGPNPGPGVVIPRPPAVFYIRPDSKVIKIADGIARPNGVILSPDEKTLYVADTLGAAVVAFDVQSDGGVRNRRDFAKLAGVTNEGTGVRSGADGLAVDEAGRLFVATQVGVQVFSPEGRALGTIPIGIIGGPQNLAFAGPGKKTLYVVGRGAMWKVVTQTQGPKGRAK